MQHLQKDCLRIKTIFISLLKPSLNEQKKFERLFFLEMA